MTEDRRTGSDRRTGARREGSDIGSESVADAFRNAQGKLEKPRLPWIERSRPGLAVPDWQRVMRWQVLLPLLLIMVWAGLGIRYMWLSSQGASAEPLIGMWRTAFSTHQDRGFGITEDTMRFYLDESSPQAYPIRSVRSERESIGTLYTIEYEQDGAVVSMALFLGTDGTLRLPNLDHILWFRTSRAP